MSVTFRLTRSPSDEYHFNALGIDPATDFVLQTNDALIETVEQPFAKGSVATVFHVHEVMRILLSQLNLTDREGSMMAHSTRISSQFERLSYHAASVWSDWGFAVDKAGGAIRTILQRMFGVRIRQKGWWIPHLESKYIEADIDWSIIDDVVTTTHLLKSSSSGDLWMSMDTGLRLLRNSAKPSGCSESLEHFFGRNHRFESASAWLQWSMDNGTQQQLPSDQGTTFYYKGVINNEVPRYYSGQVRKNGPFGSEWWSTELDAPDVPKFAINDEAWAFGVLWKYDEEQSKWMPTYPHLRQLGEGDPVLISASGLGLDIVTEGEEVEENDLGPLDVRRSLNNHLVTEHLRAIRILLIELGHAQQPNAGDTKIGGLGLAGSSVPSPFSDLYFLSSNSASSLGVVIGSPIETIIRREILENNWYVVE